MSNAGANNKARTAAASDSASVVYLPDYAHLFNPNRKKDHVTPSGPGPSPHSVKTAAATYKGLKGAATVATVASGGCSIQ